MKLIIISLFICCQYKKNNKKIEVKKMSDNYNIEEIKEKVNENNKKIN